MMAFKLRGRDSFKGQGLMMLGICYGAAMELPSQSGQELPQ